VVAMLEHFLSVFLFSRQKSTKKGCFAHRSSPSFPTRTSNRHNHPGSYEGGCLAVGHFSPTVLTCREHIGGCFKWVKMSNSDVHHKYFIDAAEYVRPTLLIGGLVRFAIFLCFFVFFVCFLSWGRTALSSDFMIT
jgi:hypothetical protein